MFGKFTSISSLLKLAYLIYQKGYGAPYELFRSWSKFSGVLANGLDWSFKKCSKWYSNWIAWIKIQVIFSTYISNHKEISCIKNHRRHCNAQQSGKYNFLINYNIKQNWSFIHVLNFLTYLPWNNKCLSSKCTEQIWAVSGLNDASALFTAKINLALHSLSLGKEK